MGQDPRNYVVDGQQRATYDPTFYQERLKEAKGNGVKAIIEDLDWDEVNKIHLEKIRKHINSNHKIIDIGCGPGRAARFFTDEQYTGIDFIPEFIKIAKYENPGKKFEIVDINFDLPFREKEFDWAVVISLKGTMFNGDPKDPLNIWPPFEDRIKRIAKNILILEYSRGWEEIIKCTKPKR